jgi:hypothetical protein
MSKKLKPSEDPNLFEYEPHDDDVSDEDMLDMFYAIKEKPENITDKAFREKYIAYIASKKS